MNRGVLFRGSISELFRGNLALLGAVFAGAALRAYQLPGQILVDDEWHALHKIIHSDYAEILTSFGNADYSIPIALYYKLATDTVGLSEWVIRTPFFVAGALTVLIVPLLLRRHVGRFASDILAWLLALSPLLVFFSRFARPYSIVVLFGSVAVLVFHAWWIEHRARDAVMYAILTVLTGYFTLVALPFVLGPFAFFLVATLRGPAAHRRAEVKRLAWLGLGTAGPLLVLLAPPFSNDFRALSVKAGHGTVDWNTVLQVLQVMAGAGVWWVAVGVIVLAGIGLFRMYRTAPRFGAFLAVLILIQVIAVAVASPRGVERAPVLGRYLLPVLPVLLLFAAVGLRWAAGLAGSFRGKGLHIAVVAGTCTILFVSGPLSEVYYRPNNWTSNVLKRGLRNKPDPLRSLQRKLRRVPEFYRTLSQYPSASRVVVEAPSLLGMGRNPLPVYQKIHRQKTLVGFVNGLCSKPRPGEVPYSPPGGGQMEGPPGIRLRNFVFLADPDELVKRGVDYVVFHRHLLGETKRPPRRRRHLDVSACIAKYRTLFGRPVFSDSDIVVFEIPGPTAASPASSISAPTAPSTRCATSLASRPWCAGSACPAELRQHPTTTRSHESMTSSGLWVPATQPISPIAGVLTSSTKTISPIAGVLTTSTKTISPFAGVLASSTRTISSISAAGGMSASRDEALFASGQTSHPVLLPLIGWLEPSTRTLSAIAGVSASSAKAILPFLAAGGMSASRMRLLFAPGAMSELKSRRFPRSEECAPPAFGERH